MFIKQFMIFLLISFSSLYAYEIVEVKNLKLIKVIDGDTITVEDENKKHIKIRLLGIDTPEITTDPIEHYGVEATNKLIEIIGDESYVNIKYVKSNKFDKYNRILANVYTSKNNIWLNGELIKQGYAVVYIINSSEIPNIQQLLEWQDKAIEKQEHVWSLQSRLPLNAKEAIKYIGAYKIIDAKIIGTHQSKNSLWLYLSEQGNKGLSIRVDNKNIQEFNKVHNIDNIIGKSIRIQGYIDKYSPKFGPYIEVKNPYALQIK